MAPSPRAEGLKISPDIRGFRTHAFRHIIATTWLNAHPNDFLTVALILHDCLETVMQNYAHLKTKDGMVLDIWDADGLTAAVETVPRRTDHCAAPRLTIEDASRYLRHDSSE
jgi:hypothetical protein